MSSDSAEYDRLLRKEHSLLQELAQVKRRLYALAGIGDNSPQCKQRRSTPEQFRHAASMRTQ